MSINLDLPTWNVLLGRPVHRLGSSYRLDQYNHYMRTLLDLFRYTPAPDTKVLFAAGRAAARVAPRRPLFFDGAAPPVVAAAILCRLLGAIPPCGLLCKPEDIEDIVSRSVFKGSRQLEKIFGHTKVRFYFEQIAHAMNVDLHWPVLLTRQRLHNLLDDLDIELVSTEPGTHELEHRQLADFLRHRLAGTETIAKRLMVETHTSELGACAQALLADEKDRNLWRAAARTALHIDGYDLCLGGRCYATEKVATAALVTMKNPGEGLSSALLMLRRILGPGDQGILLLTDPAYDPYSTVPKRVSSATFCAEVVNMLCEFRVLCGLPGAVHLAAPYSFSTKGSAPDKHLKDQLEVAGELMRLINMPYVQPFGSTLQLDAGLETIIDDILDAAKLEPDVQGTVGVAVAKSVGDGNPVIKALCLHHALMDRAGPLSHFTSADPATPWATRSSGMHDLSRADNVFAIATAASAMTVFDLVHDFAARERVRRELRKHYGPVL